MLYILYFDQCATFIVLEYFFFLLSHSQLLIYLSLALLSRTLCIFPVLHPFVTVDMFPLILSSIFVLKSIIIDCCWSSFFAFMISSAIMYKIFIVFCSVFHFAVVHILLLYLFSFFAYFVVSIMSALLLFLNLTTCMVIGFIVSLRAIVIPPLFDFLSF